MEKYFREGNARRRMTRQTTTPPSYRNQTSRPVGNRFTITSNMNNKTPPTQNIQPRMNNFTKLENRPLNERSQTKRSNAIDWDTLPINAKIFEYRLKQKPLQE